MKASTMFGVKYGVTSRHLWEGGVFDLKRDALAYIDALDEKYAWELNRMTFPHPFAVASEVKVLSEKVI